MSAAEVAKGKLGLQELEDCLPATKQAFDRLKKRIGELELLIVGSNRDHEHRAQMIAETEAIHADIADLLEDILG